MSVGYYQQVHIAKGYRQTRELTKSQETICELHFHFFQTIRVTFGGFQDPGIMAKETVCLSLDAIHSYFSGTRAGEIHFVIRLERSKSLSVSLH